jgi:thiol-disulfide isomerase/thioredoxin
LLLTGAFTLSCTSRATVTDISSTEWSQLIDARSAATVVYAWASWSRNSVELLPTVLELQREYEPLGIDFVYVSLDVDSPEPAIWLMHELNGPPFFRLTTSLEEAAEQLGIHELPTLRGYPVGESEPITLDPALHGLGVSPADAVALLEQLLPENL